MEDVAVREMQQKHRGAKPHNQAAGAFPDIGYRNSRASSASIFTAATGQGTAIRVFGLLLTPAVAFGMLAAFGGSARLAAMLVWAVWIACGVGFYFLPTYEANIRRQPNMTSIVVLNVFLGWTLVGWVVAMVWGCADRQSVTGSSQPDFYDRSPASAPLHAASSRQVFGPITAPVKADIPVVQPHVVSTVPALAPSGSVADELRKLADLREQGILTEEEFRAQKSKLLSA